MHDVFKTFSPDNLHIKKYVQYYYLDIKQHNECTTYECYPHYNTTISLYKSHVNIKSKGVFFKEGGTNLQLFTPVRDTVLKVRQYGKLHRVVIVFEPLGIQQFFPNMIFTHFTDQCTFLEPHQIKQIFACKEVERLTQLLDQFLIERFEYIEFGLMQQALDYIYGNHVDFSVDQLAKSLQCSRQHINRLFKQHLGVSVKKFAAIYKFRQTMAQYFKNDTTVNFTDLAYQFNFSDQSHFNKLYKTLTAKAPSYFFAKGTSLGEQDTFWHFK